MDLGESTCYGRKLNDMTKEELIEALAKMNELHQSRLVEERRLRDRLLEAHKPNSWSWIFGK